MLFYIYAGTAGNFQHSVYRVLMHIAAHIHMHTYIHISVIRSLLGNPVLVTRGILLAR